MIFKCRVCSEKDARIADLKAEIATLRELVLPRDPFKISPIALEADAVLTPSNDSPIISDEEIQEAEEIQSEATRLFAGNY